MAAEGVGQAATEKLLDDMIVARPEILSADWMLIGRQEFTDAGGRIDLLAVAPDGSLVLIELKRDKTPREIVAQAIDYASWVERLTSDQLAQIYARYSGGGSLTEAFKARFGEDLDEDALYGSHQIVVVAAELDDSTERIVAYLNERDVPINVLLFQVFANGPDRLLSRAWLIDPGETQSNAASAQGGGPTKPGSKSAKEPWNGEFYVTFGSGRSWPDAQRYGYISAGNGKWYSQTLNLLSPGDRVWVNIPQTGYVGVGRVAGRRQIAADVRVSTPDGDRPVLDVIRDADRYRRNASDPDLAEYFVPVQWLDTPPEERAFKEVGLYGLQLTVCRPQVPKWRHTIERLKTVFTQWDAPPARGGRGR